MTNDTRTTGEIAADESAELASSYEWVGRRVAALLGTTRDWKGGDMLAAIAELIAFEMPESVPHVGDSDPAAVAYWQRELDRLDEQL